MELHSTLIWNKSLIIVGGLIKENDVYETSDYIYWLDLGIINYYINKLYFFFIIYKYKTIKC